MVDGNIFTKTSINNLPKHIQIFIADNKLKIIGKDELYLLYSKELQTQISSKSLSDELLNKKRFDKLESILSNLCHTSFSTVERKKYLAQNSCKKYYDEKNKDMSGKESMEYYLPGIGDSYIEGIIKNIDNPEYDIIFVLNRENEKKRIDQSIAGFVITEKSECKDKDNLYTDIPALKLICVSSKNKNKFVSRLLVYLYLYSLKEANYRYGLLELAGSYCNLPGLCLYNKFGFREDLSIKTDTCFPEIGTLTMIADLPDISYKELEKALTSKTSDNVELPDSEPLCSKPKKFETENERQNLVQDIQEKVKIRMENYDNILKLQNGELTLDEFENTYVDYNVKPKEVKEAIKYLSKSSKQGKLILKNSVYIPNYFTDNDNIDSVSKNEKHNTSRRRRRDDISDVDIEKSPRNPRRKIESSYQFRKKNKTQNSINKNKKYRHTKKKRKPSKIP